MSRRIILGKLPVIGGNETLPGLSRLASTEYMEIMLRCKSCNQIVPVSKALEHQLMHKNKGEDTCFTVEASQISRAKSIWYSNEII